MSRRVPESSRRRHPCHRAGSCAKRLWERRVPGREDPDRSSPNDFKQAIFATRIRDAKIRTPLPYPTQTARYDAPGCYRKRADTPTADLTGPARAPPARGLQPRPWGPPAFTSAALPGPAVLPPPRGGGTRADGRRHRARAGACPVRSAPFVPARSQRGRAGSAPWTPQGGRQAPSRVYLPPARRRTPPNESSRGLRPLDPRGKDVRIQGVSVRATRNPR